MIYRHNRLTRKDENFPFLGHAVDLAVVKTGLGHFEVRLRDGLDVDRGGGHHGGGHHGGSHFADLCLWQASVGFRLVSMGVESWNEDGRKVSGTGRECREEQRYLS